jgi:hypothetical protein
MRDTARKKREIMYQAVLALLVHERKGNINQRKAAPRRSSANGRVACFFTSRSPSAAPGHQRRPGLLSGRAGLGAPPSTPVPRPPSMVFFSLYFDLCIKKKEEKKCMFDVRMVPS